MAQRYIYMATVFIFWCNLNASLLMVKKVFVFMGVTTETSFNRLCKVEGGKTINLAVIGNALVSDFFCFNKVIIPIFKEKTIIEVNNIRMHSESF